jgi:hypothetical protein
MATYLAGQTVRLAADVTDDDGDPVDPATCSITITLPDNSTVTGVIGDFTHAGTGVYRYDYVPTAAGTYDWRIVSTVPADAFEGSFDVEAAGGTFDDPVSLDDVRAYLNLPNTLDDTELRSFISAAVGLIEDLIGPIVPVTVTETFDGGGRQISLRTTPVISVQTVTERMAQSTYTDTLDDAAGGSFHSYGYQLDGETITKQMSGFPVAFFPGRRNVAVTYTAGRSSLSPKLQKAIAEQVRHLWQTQQGSRSRQTEDWSPQMAFSIPNRVKELLGIDMSLPGFGG